MPERRKELRLERSLELEIAQDTPDGKSVPGTTRRQLSVYTQSQGVVSEELWGTAVAGWNQVWTPTLWTLSGPIDGDHQERPEG